MKMAVENKAEKAINKYFEMFPVRSTSDIGIDIGVPEHYNFTGILLALKESPN